MALSVPEDAQSTRLGEPVFRPLVQVALVNGQRCTSQLTGLIDNGADAILASNLLTVELGIRHRGPRRFDERFGTVLGV